MRLCTIPGCEQPHYAKGRCKRHYMRDWRAKQLPEQLPEPRRGPKTLLGGFSDEGNTPKGGSTITLWPARPKRVTDALHALAETPGLTTSEYETRKAHILKGADT